MFYIMHYSHFKGCCGLGLFYNHKKMVCILLFESNKTMVNVRYHGYKNHDFYVYFLGFISVKTMASS